MMTTYDRWITAGLFFTLGIALLFGAYLIDESNHRETTAARIEEERIERGEVLYSANCAACHGLNGEGLAGVFPTLNSKDFLEKATDTLIFNTILLGRPNTAMPAWGQAQGGPFTDEDILDLTVFLRNWESTAPLMANTQPVAEQVVGDPLRGANLFSLFCYFCHGVNGEGSQIAPALNDPVKLAQFSDDWYADTIRQGRDALGMPTWGTVLSDQQINDLVSFIRAWSDGDSQVAVSDPMIAGDAVRGAALFEVTCSVCHGSNGVGTERAPALNDPQLISSRSIDDFYRIVIAEGRLEHGMPRWGQVLSPVAMNDLLALLAYWGSSDGAVVQVPSQFNHEHESEQSSNEAGVQVPPESQSAVQPPVDEVLVSQGEALFLRDAGGIGCAYCHGQDARGNVGPNIRGKSYEAIMQAFGVVPQMVVVSNLTDEQVRAVAAYLATLPLDGGTSSQQAPQPQAQSVGGTPTSGSSTPSPSPTNTATPTPDSSASTSVDAELVAQGEALFLREAGGIGCAYCHGQDARGNVGPNIRGKSYEAIMQAFGTVPQMVVVTNLTDEQVRAVAAYLATLPLGEPAP